MLEPRVQADILNLSGRQEPLGEIAQRNWAVYTRGLRLAPHEDDEGIYDSPTSWITPIQIPFSQ